jgi:hypothetical protein
MTIAASPGASQPDCCPIQHYTRKGRSVVRKSGSQLRDSQFVIAESVLSEQIGKALRKELGTSRHATKEVMRWTCVSDKTARAWINGRAAPSGAHLLTLAANSRRVMNMVLCMTGHPDLEVGFKLKEIEQGLVVALAQIRAISPPAI